MNKVHFHAGNTILENQISKMGGGCTWIPNRSAEYHARIMTSQPWQLYMMRFDITLIAKHNLQIFLISAHVLPSCLLPSTTT